MDWSIVAIALQIIAAGAVIFAAVLLIGVLGGQWLIKRQIIEARDAAELANSRITREIKTRAGQAGQEARQEAKSIDLQAQEALALAAASGSVSEAPSTLSSINGGHGGRAI